MSNTDGAVEAPMAFSLAELANLNTDDVALLTSRLPPQGLYLVDGVKVAITQSENSDPAQPPIYRVGFTYNVLDCKLVDDNIDPSSRIGKEMRESYTLWANDIDTAIGLLKGRYKLAVLPYQGNLGGVEGQPAGWLDSMSGSRFQLRIRHFGRRDGSQAANFDWLKYEPDESTE
jgi:hypothetical protein